MNELDTSARELIDAARAEEGPTAVDLHRGRARLAATLAASAVASTTSLASGAQASAVPGAAATKLGVLGWTLAGLGLVATVAVIALWPDRAPSAPPREPSAPAAVLSSAPARTSVERPDPPVAPVKETPAPKPTAKASVTRRPAVREESPSKMSLEEEMRVVSKAQVALRDGDAARALEILDQQARHPGDARQLAEERDVIRVLALCKLGRVAEARALADAFTARSPKSPLATRVRASCVSDSVPK